MTSEADQKKYQEWHADPKNWKWGIFYYNKEDKRILPPKRIGWLGWTINFANTWSVVVFILLLAAIASISLLIR